MDRKDIALAAMQSLLTATITQENIEVFNPELIVEKSFAIADSFIAKDKEIVLREEGNDIDKEITHYAVMELPATPTGIGSGDEVIANIQAQQNTYIQLAGESDEDYMNRMMASNNRLSAGQETQNQNIIDQPSNVVENLINQQSTPYRQDESDELPY